MYPRTGYGIRVPVGALTPADHRKRHVSVKEIYRAADNLKDIDYYLSLLEGRGSQAGGFHSFVPGSYLPGIGIVSGEIILESTMDRLIAELQAKKQALLQKEVDKRAATQTNERIVDPNDPNSISAKWAESLRTAKPANPSSQSTSGSAPRYSKPARQAFRQASAPTPAPAPAPAPIQSATPYARDSGDPFPQFQNPINGYSFGVSVNNPGRLGTEYLPKTNGLNIPSLATQPFFGSNIGTQTKSKDILPGSYTDMSNHGVGQLKDRIFGEHGSRIGAGVGVPNGVIPTAGNHPNPNDSGGSGEKGSLFKILSDVGSFARTNAGNILSTYATIKGMSDQERLIRENMARTTPNINPYEDYGVRGLHELDQTRNLAEIHRDRAMAELASSSAINDANIGANTLSSNGSNVMRQAAYNDGLSQRQKINDAYYAQMADYRLRRSQQLSQMDQLSAQGRQAQDLANRQDIDNYYSQLNNALQTRVSGYQTLANDYNAYLRNDKMANLIAQLSQYGFEIGPDGRIVKLP